MSDFVLNQEQQWAVKYNKGPLLIIAGAGTGKTSVIIEKIKYLVKKKLAKPEQILALTFTEKAAAEMEERVDRAMPYGYFQMSISTFHAFADQILKENGYQIGLSPNFRLMTEAETLIFLKQNLFLFNLKYFRPLGNPNKFLEALLQHFSRLRDEDISPEDYLKWIKTQKTETEKYLELAEAYQTYQKLKIKEGLMDFADLVYYLLRLFYQRPNVLKRYQQKYPFVLVDEFQDTNIAQYQLIKFLCPTKKNLHLTIVADDSQAIYKFRGASVSNIITFMKDYKKAKQITLKKNYRSNQTILDNAYQLIKNNDPDTLEAQLGISKNLTANIPDDKDALDFYLAEKIETWENALPSFIKLAYLPSPGLIRLRLSTEGYDKESLMKNINLQVEKLKDVIPEFFWNDKDEKIEETIGRLLIEQQKTLATAESCTGGYIAYLITSISGSSNYFKGAIIAYSNEVKQTILGVKKESIEEYGAVSKQVVEEMAKGVVEGGESVFKSLQHKLKISYSKFLKLNSFVTLILVSSFLVAGWLAGKGYTIVLDVFKSVQLGISFLIVFFVVFYILQKKLKKWYIKKQGL